MLMTCSLLSCCWSPWHF